MNDNRDNSFHSFAGTFFAPSIALPFKMRALSWNEYRASSEKFWKIDKQFDELSNVLLSGVALFFHRLKQFLIRCSLNFFWHIYSDIENNRWKFFAFESLTLSLFHMTCLPIFCGFICWSGFKWVSCIIIIVIMFYILFHYKRTRELNQWKMIPSEEERVRKIIDLSLVLFSPYNSLALSSQCYSIFTCRLSRMKFEKHH